MDEDNNIMNTDPETELTGEASSEEYSAPVPAGDYGDEEPIVPIVPGEEVEVLADIPEMTDDEIFQSVCELDGNETYSQSVATIMITKVNGYADLADEEGNVDEEAITEDMTEEVMTVDLSNYILSISTLDGEHITAEFTFYSADDASLEDACDACNKYLELAAAFHDGESSDLPMFTLSIMPYRGAGRYTLNCLNPVHLSKGVTAEGDPTCVDMVFHLDAMETQEYRITQAEYNQLRDDAIQKEKRKQELNATPQAPRFNY